MQKRWLKAREDFLQVALVLLPEEMPKACRGYRVQGDVHDCRDQARPKA